MSDKICELCGNNECKMNGMDMCSRFKPKDKPMENKIIFESEEEFSRYDNQVNDSTYKGRLKKAKERGFICKSPIEEAEEMYKEWLQVADLKDPFIAPNEIKLFITASFKAVESLYEAIQYLNQRMLLNKIGG